MQLDNAIKTRKSVRAFTSRKPDWKKIIEAIDSMRYAPLAGNNFTLKAILVSDSNKIQKIGEACQQNHVILSNYILVVCSKKDRLINEYEERGEIYNKQQIGASIQNFLLKIEELGLSTCWIGHFVEEIIKNELKIPENLEVEALFPIGFDAENTKQAPKIQLDSFLYFEKYGNKKMNKIHRID